MSQSQQIVVINPFASRLVKNQTLLEEVIACANTYHAQMVMAYTVEEMLAQLQRLNLQAATVYVVGGDGSFRQVLNYLLHLPKNARPYRLMPVGGGQFNFMTKHVGLKDPNPASNLQRIFSGKQRLKGVPWKPLEVRDVRNQQSYYCAVAANGVLCDVTEWYLQAGKGDMLRVIPLVYSVISDFLLASTRNTTPRVRRHTMSIVADGNKLPFTDCAGFLSGAVPEFLPHCRPFNSPPTIRAFSNMIYWGPYSRLCLSTPLMWIGLPSPLTDPMCFNDRTKRLEITTQDGRLLLDGDIIHLPTPSESGQPPVHELIVHHGPTISLSRCL